jgi:exosome complex RNA-binding protein Rrp42 (RNase PH superfamily)
MKCRVLAQVHADMVKPRDDRPYEGFLLINSEISPMASSVYERDRCVSLTLGTELVVISEKDLG